MSSVLKFNFKSVAAPYALGKVHAVIGRTTETIRKKMRPKKINKA